ncbi:histone transcription regulator 3 homolog [[Candida] jaroonii]|uniref:Histone transcription regulator 3 homolog n=1 Tax=[Candida] jaroonii TaxID=467808 RepID=A0ACA9Y0J4_9ASCO|nr:histone transcription regulator 3 homolog [[Candida] jaroonii]
MAFVPINLIEDPSVSRKDIEAEHTRELQVEQAFKTFENALNCQKEGKLDDCHRSYESLFKLDIISNHYLEEEDYIKGIQNGSSNTIVDELNFLAPNVKSLRYLIFRNRAFFYLDLLKGAPEKLSVFNKFEDETWDQEKIVERTKETFYSMIDDMGIALLYQEADEILLETLYDILTYMNASKLARYTLEYILSKKVESDDILGLLPLNGVTIKLHKNMIQKLQCKLFDTKLDQSHRSRIEKEYNFLENIRNEYMDQVNELLSSKDLVVNIRNQKQDLKWEDITSSINEKIKAIEDKSRTESTSASKIKNIDPYYFTSYHSTRLIFHVSDKGNLTTDDIDESAVEEEPKEEDMEVDDSSPEPEKEADDEVSKEEEPKEEAPKDGEEITDSKDTPEVETVEIAETVEDNEPTKTDNEVQEIIDVDNLPDQDVIEVEDDDEGMDVEVIEPEKDEKSDAKDKEEAEIEGETKIEDQGPKNNKNIQRASKRLQKNELESLSWLPNIPLNNEMFHFSTAFFQQMNTHFSVLEGAGSLKDVSDLFVNPPSDPLFYQDFVEILNSYEVFKAYSGFVKGPNKLAQKQEDDERLKLLEVLRSFGTKPRSITDPSPVSLNDQFNDEQMKLLINELNSSNLHVTDVKIRILKYLLGIQTTGSCLVCDTVWTEKLLKDVKTWILQLDQQILQKSKDILRNEKPQLLGELVFSVSLYEMITDIYITSKNKIDNVISHNMKTGFSRSLKGTLNLQTSEITKLRYILERWKLHIDSILYLVGDEANDIITKTLLRFQWALIHKENTEDADFQSSKFIADQLSKMLGTLKSLNGEKCIKMSNYENLYDIDEESITDLGNTIGVLTMFAKILYANDRGNNEESVYLLERTLIDSKYFPKNSTRNEADEVAITTIKNFLDNSTIDTKLNLWNILFSYYNKENDFVKYQFGFEKNLETLYDFICSDSYNKIPKPSRYSTLLEVLSFFDEYLMMYLGHLSKRSWQLEGKLEDIKTTHTRLMELFQLFYIFSLHEESCLITARKTTVAQGSPIIINKFKAMLARSATIVVLYFDKLCTLSGYENSETNTNQLLSLIHSQFGFRKLCDGGDCVLLQMFQDRLLLTNTEAYQSEVLQILSCRYRCNITSNGFTPVDHQTDSKAKFDKESIGHISKLVLPLCIDRNPLYNPPRGDFKVLLDEFYEVVSDPDYDNNSMVIYNDSIFNQYLDNTTITPRLLKEAFHGLLTTEFIAMNDERSPVIQQGLFFLQAVIIFSSYKIRKKSMQGRSMEIEKVIQLLKSDLIYNTNRVESWFILGQAYSFLVEDDLIWTSDKLVIADRKFGTANLQRRSLLCYLMAISLSNSDSTVHKNKKLSSDLMSSFAIELFNACMSPMEMLAFKVTDYPRFLRVNSKCHFVLDAPVSRVSKELCIRVIQQSLHLAIKLQPKEWFNYYILSKIQGKMKLEPDLVFETLLEAIKYSKNSTQSSSTSLDLSLEPHYRLCSIAYKYVKSETLQPSQVIPFIDQDPIFNGIEKSITDDKSFFRFIITCLKKLESIDKKRWHHKYRYRMAKIYVEDFEELQEAKEEMSSIISLKPTSKTLVSIWKPDNERPGKHFFYTYQYILLFIDILIKEQNLTGLIQMLPRLRRSNSIMLNLGSAWAVLCNSICHLIRDISEIGTYYTEQFLVTPYQNFIFKANWILEECKKNSFPKEFKTHSCLLNALNDMKKLNNGFGQTALIDDTICSLFIKIYKSLNQPDPGPPVPTDYRKIKKLAKKDMYPFIFEFLKAAKKDIDNVMKENPDIFNDFVKQVVEERRQFNASLIPIVIEDGPDGPEVVKKPPKPPKPVKPVNKVVDLDSPTLPPTITIADIDNDIMEINSPTPIPSSPNIKSALIDISREDTEEFEDAPAFESPVPETGNTTIDLVEETQ